MSRRPEDLKIMSEKKLELAQEIKYLYEELDKPIERGTEALMDALDFRCQWLSRTSQILAEAEILYDAAKGDVSEEYIGTEEGWNIVKPIIEARVREEKRLYLQADRLNSTVVHSMDSIRSMLSCEKEEKIKTGWGNNSHKNS